MDNQTINNQQSKKTGGVALVIRTFLLALMSLAITAAILFLSSGRLDWVMAWVHLGLIAAAFFANSMLVGQELIDERTRFKEEEQEVKRWDQVIVPLVKLFGGMFAWVVAGLDMRFGWTAELLQPVSLAAQLVALGFVVLGQAMLSWAMASNRFFSDMVRIQKDRGHTVSTGGPYRYVRHPGYLGSCVYTVAVPVMLGSLWALIPAVIAFCLLIARTALEDKTLQEELNGYREFAGRVRYRLVPGIW